MKKYHILVVFLAINLFFSCSNDEIAIDQPEIIGQSEIIEQPEMRGSNEIDINNDGKADYIIEYSHGLIFSPTSDEIMIGYFNTVGENQILHKKQVRNLFLRSLSEIEENVLEPLFWNNSGWTEDIVSIKNNIDGTSPTQWTVHSENEQSSYFLGLKLIDSNLRELGWVELNINPDNGKITVVDKGIF